MDTSITIGDIESARKVLGSIKAEIENAIHEVVDEDDFDDVKYLLRNRRTVGHVQVYVEQHGEAAAEINEDYGVRIGEQAFNEMVEAIQLALGDLGEAVMKENPLADIGRATDKLRRAIGLEVSL